MANFKSKGLMRIVRVVAGEKIPIGVVVVLVAVVMVVVMKGGGGDQEG